jgi:hypothetical protein
VAGRVNGLRNERVVAGRFVEVPEREVGWAGRNVKKDNITRAVGLQPGFVIAMRVFQSVVFH